MKILCYYLFSMLKIHVKTNENKKIDERNVEKGMKNKYLFKYFDRENSIHTIDIKTALGL